MEGRTVLARAGSGIAVVWLIRAAQAEGLDARWSLAHDETCGWHHQVHVDADQFAGWLIGQVDRHAE